jgi:hypothetical protein
MSCSGVGGVGPGPYQFLQASTGQQTASDASATDDATATNAASTAQLQIQIQAQGQSGSHHHHHGGGNRASGGDAVSDLLSTIEQALQSADSSDDPNKVIEDTITKLLSGDGSTEGTRGNDSSVTATATAQSDAKQSFADVLKSHGVDFQQFRADLLAAVKDAQNGQVDPSTALQSFAPGSSVDLTA